VTLLVETADSDIVNCLLNKEIADVMIFFFNYLRRATSQLAADAPTFETYIARRKAILTQIKLQPRHLEKIQNILLLEYLIEHFMAETLTEKTMSCYYRYFREVHASTIESILKCPENLRTIIGSMSNRNENFLLFLLECLYVVRQNSDLNRAILEALRKCNADKFLAKKLGEIEFSSKKSGIFLEWEPKMAAEKAKFVDAALQILTMALCRTNPVAQDHFLKCKAEGESVCQLLGSIMKLACQRSNRSLREDADSVLESVITNLNSLVPGTVTPDDQSERTSDSPSMEVEQASIDTRRDQFSHRVVTAIKEGELIRSRGFFKLCALFVRTKSAKIIALLIQETCFPAFVKTAFDLRFFGKQHAAVLIGMLRVAKFCPRTQGAHETPVFRDMVGMLMSWGATYFQRENLLSSGIACLLREAKTGTQAAVN